MKKIGLSIFTLIAFIGYCGTVYSNDFASFKKQFIKDRNNFIQQEKLQYETYKKNLRRELATFKAKIRGVWGYADVTSQHKLVVYSKDYNEKVLIDYRSSEVFYSSTNPSSLSKAETLLTNTFLTPISRLTREMTLSATTALNQYSLSNELTVADSLGFSKQDVSKIVKDIAVQAVTVRETERIQANIEDNKRTLAILKHHVESLNHIQRLPELIYAKELEKEQLISQRLEAKLNRLPTSKHPITKKATISHKRWERSKPYRQFVTAQSKHYQLEPALLYAIMETESSFNPLARSPIPAFGLMQVVPTTAGVDVNLSLHKIRKAPEVAQLLEAETNVLYGSTYMSILLNKYCKNVSDQTSRLYCSIAAYNTGIGNVAKIFSQGGKLTIADALAQMNQLSANEVFDTIKQKAHPETQSYIEKVIAAKRFYEQYI